MRIHLLMCCAVVFVVGCGGSGPGGDVVEGDMMGSDGTISGDTVEPPLADPVTFETSFEEGEVRVPDGVDVEKVVNGFGETYLDNGGFYLNTATGARQLVVALSPSGQPLVMGWFGRFNEVIDARSTAEVLAFYALGAARVAGDPAHVEKVMKLLGNARALDTVASAINAALVAHPSGFTAAEDPAVAAALEAAVQTILGLDLSANGLPNALLVNPASELSGLTIDQSGSVNAFSILNRFRRRGVAIVDRVSTFKNRTKTPSPERIAVMSVPPVEGMPGAVGTIVQLIRGTEDPSGLYKSENVAYSPKHSESVEVPNVEGADKTRYRVLVVGPGRNQGDYDSLDETERDIQSDAAVEFCVRDYLLPFLLHMVVPPSQSADVMNTAAGDQVVAAFVRVLGDDPELRAATGVGALSKIALIVIGGGAAQAKLVDILDKKLFQAAGSAAAKGKMYTAVKTFAVVSASASLLLKLQDARFIEADMGASNKADIWTIDVDEPLVRLEPRASTVAPGEIVNLTTFIPQADSGQFEYRFSTPGEFGTLQTAIKRGNDITSSQPFIVYDAKSPGSEEVEVIVYEVQGAERIELGSAVATVTVSGIGVRVTPRAGEVEPFGRLSMTATMAGDELPETLRFRWRTDGTFGTFDGETEVQATVAGEERHSVAFVAGFEPGEATVTVDVFGPTGDEVLATASTTVDVQPFQVVIEPTVSNLQPGAAVDVTAVVRPQPPRGELVFSWVLDGEGTVDGAPTVTHTVTANDRDAVTYQAPGAAPTECVQHLRAEILFKADGKSVTLPIRSARIGVDCPAEVVLSASSDSVEVLKTAVMSATIAGSIPAGPLTYSWSLDGPPEGTSLTGSDGPLGPAPTAQDRVTLQAGNHEGAVDVWVTVRSAAGVIGTATRRVSIDREPCQDPFPLAYWQREAGAMSLSATGRWGGRVTAFINVPSDKPYSVSVIIPRGVGGREAVQVSGDVGSISQVQTGQQVLYDINWTDNPEPPRIRLDGALISLNSVKGPIAVSMPTSERLPACESYRFAPTCCPIVIPDETFGNLITGPLVGATVHNVGRSIAVIESN